MHMRKKRFKRSLSIILALMMLFTTMPALAFAESGADGVQVTESEPAVSAVDPKKATEAAGKISDAIKALSGDTADLSKLESFFTRFGGLTSAATGVIGLLQLAGIIKDPTTVALNQILDTVKDIQTQINLLDAKLDDITQRLDSIAVSQEEKSRAANAISMQGYWNGFNTDYTEKLDDLMNIYQAKINEGIKVWWDQRPDEGVWVLYTADKHELTYSSAPYSDGIPAQADNGEAVSDGYSFDIPKDLLTGASSGSFNINTYRTNFVKSMSDRILDLAERGQLHAGDEFYTSWNAMRSGQKQEAADRYAEEILNTVVYHIACDRMSKDNQWVVEVTNAYKNYCNNVLKLNSGISAFLNYIYLTHGFEGEVKEDIEKFCNGMVAQAGVYGQFALSCAGQDNMQSLADRQILQNYFVDTVLKLSEVKKKALTGHDNYCYITGTLVERATVSASATTTSHLHSDMCATFYGLSSTDWTATVPSIVDNVYSQVIFHQYQVLPEDASSFAAYLHKYGAFGSDDNTVLMTRYVGGREFAFNEGIRMKADSEFGDSDYFVNWDYYNIDVGTGSDVEQKYYHVHDKVLYDAFDMNTGAVSVNEMAGARAYYGESHGAWITDEAWNFYTDGIYQGCYQRGDLFDDFYREHRYKIDFSVLEQKPVKDLSSDDPDDPFLAYGAPSLTEEVSDQASPVHEDKDTPISAVVLESRTFTYTGNAIKPYVKVKAGSKTVPMDSFTIAYSENREIGIGTITVKGTGDYSGTIIESFEIVPKGTSISKAKNKNGTAAIKWKKQSAKMPAERISGYQIRYSTKKSMKGAKKVTVKGYNKTSVKIRKLKKNKKYYFQIRTYSNTKKGKVYSKWSKTKKR